MSRRGTDQTIQGDSSLNYTTSISSLAVAVALCLAPCGVQAKNELIPLSEADAKALQGKTAAVTTHETPSFVAMTAGKAAFAVLGAAGMIKAGNTFVEKNAIPDPAVLLREQLGAALRDAYGLQVSPPDTALTDEKKAAKIAKLHPETDYVLSVRSHGWNYGYYAAAWSQYWVGYTAEVQLIDTRTGRQLSQAYCGANTQSNPIRPTLDQLQADGAQLTKDILNGLGWICVQLLAKEQLKLPADKIPAIPAEYVNPLARLQPASAAAAPTTPAAAPEEAPAPEAVVEPAAEPVPATP